MTGTTEKDVCPVPFLVDDSSEISIVCIPWGRWFTGETLYTAKSGVLRTMLSLGGTGVSVISYLNCNWVAINHKC